MHSSVRTGVTSVSPRAPSQKRRSDLPDKSYTNLPGAIIENSRDFAVCLLVKSPNPILVINPDSSIIYVNPAFEELTGFSADELAGMKAPPPWWIEDTVKANMKDLNNAIARGLREWEQIFQKKNGERFWVEKTFIPVVVDDKNEYTIVKWNEISERKHSEDSLRESQAFNASLLSNAPNPILVLDLGGTIKYINPAFEELTGFSSSELIGWPVPHPFWLEEEIEENKMILEKGMSVGLNKLEKLFRKKNGDRFWVEITSAPVTNEGQFEYYIANWVDITERKRNEEKLLHYSEQLQQFSAHLEKVKEGERANISRELHDELGQALTALKMDVVWLGNHLCDDNRESLQVKTQSIVKLIDLTLQSVKRICTELRPRVLDELGLGAAIECLVEEFQQSTQITCKCKLDMKNMDLDTSISTTIFRVTQQALMNAYSHSGATLIKVEISQTDKQIIVKIHDNGRGITREQIEHPRSFGIIGMRERVNYLGGRLNIAGIKDRGTKVEARVPVVAE